MIIQDHIKQESHGKILHLGWSVQPNPPYSLDLAANDFHLFDSQQNTLDDKKIFR